MSDSNEKEEEEEEEEEEEGEDEEKVLPFQALMDQNRGHKGCQLQGRLVCEI